MLTLQALQAANTVKTAVQEIGSSPINEDGTVKGEATDGLQAKVKPSVMDVVGIAGREYLVVTMVFFFFLLMQSTPMLTYSVYSHLLSSIRTINFIFMCAFIVVPCVCVLGKIGVQSLRVPRLWF